MRALGTSLLIIPDLHVLVLTKRHVDSGNKIGKYSQLDPTLRVCEVVHARSIEFLRARNDWLPAGCIFPLNRFTVYKKSNQNQFGRVLPLH